MNANIFNFTTNIKYSTKQKHEQTFLPTPPQDTGLGFWYLYWFSGW